MPSNPFLRSRMVHTPGLYHYHFGDLFTPGAQGQVFEPAFELPIMALLGTCIPSGAPPRPLQPPQIFALKTTTIAGIGGLVSGQMAFLPVMPNPNGTE